ncbi:hypothetical protein GQ53DRAFT_884219 [Thozetella sp. PMI_491]|nr:hypothetical protein GQ53DRAFT_884219 [Thozetella sp. PMI_491]
MPPSHACDACRRRKVKCDGLPQQPRSVPVIAHQQLQQVPGDARQPSPQSYQSPGSALIFDLGVGSGTSIFSSFHHDLGYIQANLVVEVNAILAPKTITDLTCECVEYFFQYLFPNTPIAHEPTIRGAAILLAPESHSTLADLSSSSDFQLQIACLRRFTLITALCSFVTAVIPDTRLAPKIPLSKLFLLASRATLQLYEEYDLQYPDSTSLTIRMWYSAATQNRTGRVGTSYHYHAEAAYLAQRLRLYNEKAVQRESNVESQVLRAIFWLLFLADKTASALETRPPILNELLFDREFDLLDNSEKEEPLLDPSKSINQGSLEARIFVGFHLKRRIWAAAADLMSDMKALSRRKKQGLVQPVEEELELARLTEAYLLFTGLADQLPTWLRQPDNYGVIVDEEVAAYQKTCFWAQRSNIMTVFHCMKLVILQKCIDHNCTAVMGLNNTSLSWATRKIEISQEFLHELQIVERIRRVGSTLLELIHNENNETIQNVSRSQFEQLLDLLAKLDSKASDELARGPI